MNVSASSRSPTRGLSPSALAAVAFLFGIFLGGLLPKYPSNVPSAASSPTTKQPHQQSGVVLRLEDIPFRPTAHNDSQGRPILKQLLLEPFVVPNFSGFAMATFQPGQGVGIHTHKTMHEFFYITEGEGFFQINGVDHPVKPGSFLHMAPREPHNMWVPDDFKEPMKMIVCGVTIGDK